MLDETVEIHMQDLMFQEVFALEVETYDIETDIPSKHHFARTLLEAVEYIDALETANWVVSLDEDALTYFLNCVLLVHMEMWETWGTDHGLELLHQAKTTLDQFDVYYPY